MAAECADDVDGVVDDAGTGIDDDGVSIVVAALIAIGDRWQLDEDLRRHGAEALLPAWREGSVAVVLPAQAGRKIAWAVVVADEVVVVLVAEVAAVMVLGMAIAMTIAVVALVVIVAVSVSVAISVAVSVIVAACLIVAVTVVFAVAMAISVALIAVMPMTVVLWGSVSGREREGCCCGS